MNNITAYVESSTKNGIKMNSDRVNPYPFIKRKSDLDADMSEDDAQELLDSMYNELEEYEQRVRDRLNQRIES